MHKLAVIFKPKAISQAYNIIMLTRRSLSTNNTKKSPLLSDKKVESIKIEYEEEEKEISNVKLNRSMTTKILKKSASKRNTEGGWKPKKWEEMWALIKEMRSENPAAVDTMGAHCLRDPNAT
jgi:hypothetical protein